MMHSVIWLSLQVSAMNDCEGAPLIQCYDTREGALICEMMGLAPGTDRPRSASVRTVV